MKHGFARLLELVVGARLVVGALVPVLLHELPLLLRRRLLVLRGMGKRHGQQGNETLQRYARSLLQYISGSPEAEGLDSSALNPRP